MDKKMPNGEQFALMERDVALAKVEVLQAERDALAQRVEELGTRLNGVIAERERQIEINHDLRAQLTAHPAAARWEYEWKCYTNTFYANQDAPKMHEDGYTVHSWQPFEEYNVIVLWQRPARWEYTWNQGGVSEDAISQVNLWARMNGWQLVNVSPCHDPQLVLIAWQRPARQEED